MTDAPVTRYGRDRHRVAGVLDHLRPRLGAVRRRRPTAPELGAAHRRTDRCAAAARAARSRGLDTAELRDRDGGHVRAGDGGAAVAAIGRRHRIATERRRIDVIVLPPADADARSRSSAQRRPRIAYALGTLVALGDDVAGDPAIVADARRLAALVGGTVIGPKSVAIPGVAGIERSTPLAPELCVVIGGANLDLAGATSVIKIGAPVSKLVDGALPGSAATGLAELVERLKGTP